MAAVQWLTRTGQISDDKREEFILASDVLGLSMLVVQMNHRLDPAATPATVLGPFHIEGSPELGYGEDMSEGVAGTPLLPLRHRARPGRQAHCRSRPRRLAGRPRRRLRVAAADVDEARLRAKYTTREDGSYCVRTVAPQGLHDPDGRAGRRPHRADRISHFRPAHVHFLLNVPGYEPLITHLFQEGAEYLDSDVVFGTKSELVVPSSRASPARRRTAARRRSPGWRRRYDFVLQPQG